MNLYPYVQRVMALLWNRCFTIRQVAGHESDPFRKLLGHEIPSACENLAFLNPSHHTNPSAEAASHCNPFDQVSTCGTAHLVSHSLLNACETSEKSLKVTDRFLHGTARRCEEFSRVTVSQHQMMKGNTWKRYFNHQIPFRCCFWTANHGARWKVTPSPTWATHAWSSLRAGRPQKNNFSQWWKGKRIWILPSMWLKWPWHIWI